MYEVFWTLDLWSFWGHDLALTSNFTKLYFYFTFTYFFCFNYQKTILTVVRNLPPGRPDWWSQTKNAVLYGGSLGKTD